MKTCTKCKEAKPLSEFAKNKSKADGMHNQCKTCKNTYNKQYYSENKSEQYARVKARNVQQKALVKSYVWELKKAPCTDCGISYHPFVMDFDHIGFDKEYNIYQMVSGGFSLESIKREIAKCELVCSNCHRLRTGKRAGII